MNFKPFYVKTEELSVGCINSLWKLAVRNGANWYNVLTHLAKEHKYFGVTTCRRTDYFDNVLDFGSEAIELTYEEALLHVQGKIPKFAKKDLEDGDIVVTKDDCIYLLVKGTLMDITGEGFNTLEDYHEDLTCIHRDGIFPDEYDVVEVYRVTLTLLRPGSIKNKLSEDTLIWKREPELTEEDIERNEILEDIKKTKEILANLEAKLLTPTEESYYE